MTLIYDSKGFSALSDATGNFTLEHVPPGDCRVAIDDGSGMAPIFSPSIRVDPGQTAKVQVGGVERQLRADVNERRDEGREQAEKGQHDASGVHRNRSPRIEHDNAIAAFADGEHFNQVRQVTRHQRHVGRFQRDIGDLTYRDPDRVLGQSGRIVHSVTNHHYLVPAPERWLAIRSC